MFFESSCINLYDSAVAAFPNTQMRQYATHPIVVKHLRWTPFVGMKTLFIKALAQNEGREYEPILLLKQINYDGDEITITASDGQVYSFTKPSLEHADALVRCNCKDFRYRFSWYNHLDHSLYGAKPKKYVSKGVGPPANPLQMEGMCKHLIKTIHVLVEAGLFR